MRDSEEVYEESGRHRGAYAVGEHFAKNARDRRNYAEGAVVAHFEILPAGHGARLPEAVSDVAEEPGEEPDGPDEVVPVAHGEACLVVGLHGRDEGYHGKAVHEACGA